MNGILSSAPPSPTRPASSPMSEPYPIEAPTLLRVTSCSSDSCSEVILNAWPDDSQNLHGTPRCQYQSLPLLTRYVGTLSCSSAARSPLAQEIPAASRS